MTMMQPAPQLIEKLPLTTKSLLLITLVGALVWAVTDYLNLKSAENAFRAHLHEDLMKRAAEDRFRFSRYVYAHREAAKIISSQLPIIDYASRTAWSREDNNQPVIHDQLPAWLSRMSILRALVAPRLALLLDRWGQVREIYQDQPITLPTELAHPTQRLLQLSRNENYLISFSGEPYLMTSQPIRENNGPQNATLVLASPIDQEFLLASQGLPAKGFQVALVQEDLSAMAATEYGNQDKAPLTILASSDMEQLPQGARVDSLPKHLLFSQQEFFEYGASEMSFRFVTLVSADIVEPQIRQVTRNNRLSHAFHSLLFILAFALIMTLLTRRIERMTSRVVAFARTGLGQTSSIPPNSGDQLKVLEYQFQELTAAVKSHTEALEAVNTELKDFAYVVSHDLKAPLRGISQLSTWLDQDYGEALGPEGREQLTLMSNRVTRMHYLIDGILQYSRVGRVREKQEMVDLDPLVHEVVDSIVPTDSVEVEFLTPLPTIFCERVRMEQVFQNLLSNAVRYMDKPEGKVRLAAEELETFWQFRVEDNGPGIKPEYHKKIFQIFQTLAPRDEVESTGVGLSIAKKVVELHGGEIWVESKPGKGAAFLFTIAKPGSNNRPRGEVHAQYETGSFGGG